jgi:arsenate reductase
MNMTNKLRVLFLCTANSCRSQMAEGWTRHLKGDTFEAFSAGTEKQGVNPLAIKVMAEAGVDISGQCSKLISELPQEDFDLVVTVCDHAAESCPHFPGNIRIINRNFLDPPKMAAAAKTEEEKLVCFRQVRDDIRKFVDSFPKNLMVE